MQDDPFNSLKNVVIPSGLLKQKQLPAPQGSYMQYQEL